MTLAVCFLQDAITLFVLEKILDLPTFQIVLKKKEILLTIYMLSTFVPNAYSSFCVCASYILSRENIASLGHELHFGG